MNAGWYPDPDDVNARRYWDGESWSAPLPIAGPTASGGVDEGDAPSHPVASTAARSGRSLLLAGSGVAVLIVAAIVVLLVIKHNNDQDQQAAAAASSSAAASRAAASSAADASQSSVADASEAKASQAREVATLERARRELIVKALEKSVTKDARGSVSDGLLDGPIKFTDCTPVSGGSTDILTDKTGAYQCLAVTKVKGDLEHGYNYSAVINWTEASYRWHLGSS